MARGFLSTSMISARGYLKQLTQILSIDKQLQFKSPAIDDVLLVIQGNEAQVAQTIQTLSNGKFIDLGSGETFGNTIIDILNTIHKEAQTYRRALDQLS
jgi:hypothetical protein